MIEFPIRFVVVSFPAARIRIANIRVSIGLSAAAPSSAATNVLMRSSLGSRLRCSITSMK